MELTELDGVGPVRAENLRAMGITSLRDLLYQLPLRYEDYSTVSPCSTKTAGWVLIEGTVKEDPQISYYRGVSRATCSVKDSSGTMPVCWYHAPWIKNSIQKGRQVRLYGRMTVKNGRRVLNNPRFADETGFIPVYQAVKGFPSKSFRNLIISALKNTDECCPETLPEEFRLKYHLCELNFALRQAHFPANKENLILARRRLSFEKILLYLVYVSMTKHKKQAALPLAVTLKDVEKYWKVLPFHPTVAQIRVLNDVLYDLQKSTAMSRMIQGDVGSGKTAVAFGAMWLAHCGGFQSALMAPTEILAVQHYQNAKETLGKLGLRCRLLTGSTKTKERREILEEIRNHKCDAVIGTHALISEDVQYSKLGLVITDEQHRFGVRQRSLLQEKGQSNEGHAMPHVLVMSATPIPRTLALILYGDLDISVIDEYPAGRVPVKTRLVPEEKRNKMYSFLRQQIASGKQAYIICPLVEDTEDGDELKSAKALYQQLKKNELSGLNLALTWGSQKSDEKVRILNDFSAGIYDVLISTTVIEVGVNNPNATIMIIENAERYGLSQLHQLRGRVGRGSEERRGIWKGRRVEA